MPKSWGYLAAAALALAACEDRRAGTEVGNPEIAMTVSAIFEVADSQGEVDVRNLDVNVLAMRYAYADSEDGFPTRTDSGVCWYRPGGIPADLADWETPPLKDTVLPVNAWTRAEIILGMPGGPAADPDPPDFDTWKDPRHAKFQLLRNGDTLRALFEMPERMEIHLIFGEARIGYWYWDREMRVPFLFDSGEWAGGLDPRGPWAMREDGKHRRYVLFSPAENREAWTLLKDRLPSSFPADTVLVR